MEISQHASIRSRQRGFQDLDLFLLEHFGVPFRRPGNVMEYRWTQKASKQVIQALHRVDHKAILVDEIDGTMVTAYNCNNR